MNKSAKNWSTVMSYTTLLSLFFSPNDHLFQVKYTQEGLLGGWFWRKGHRCSWCEGEKSVAKLHNERRVWKTCALDYNVYMDFAGLTADARIAINRADKECQSHQLTVEAPVIVEHISCNIASLKQHYTHSNRHRPFGISALVVGFDFDGTPRLSNWPFRSISCLEGQCHPGVPSQPVKSWRRTTLMSSRQMVLPLK